VGYALTENWRTAPREGTLTVAGKTVKFHQLAGLTPCPNEPVKVGETFFEALQDGYAAAGAGDTVECQYADLEENVEFDRDVSVPIAGGYDCGDYKFPPRYP